MKTFTRGLDLLTVFANRPRCRFDELTAATRIPRSSLYRFIATLEARGFLRQDSTTKEYLPGPLLYRLGHQGNGVDRLRQAAREQMTAVVERIGESAYLYVRDGDRRLCLEAVETTQAPIKHAITPGSSFPLYAGASGKAILAFLPEEERTHLLKGMTLKKVGPRTSPTRRALQGELMRIRKQGYAYSEEEVAAGAWALAVPVCDASENCIASLGVAGPLFRLHRDRIGEQARFLRTVGERIHKTL